MADFLFGPVPHDEAVDFIASKPLVSRDVFNRLLPELRARAFTITGVDAATTVQAIRDRIAELPAGATWDSVKKDIAKKISPHFIDPDADAQERDKQVNASNRRAELLLRTHGFQAYQTASFQRMNEQKDVLPYWQYVTMGDGRVRHSHAVLNGLVLPASSPFWNTHFPPWDFGCRCQAVPLSPEEHADIRAEDAGKPADQQRALDGAALRELEQNNRLVRGPNQITSVAPQAGREHTTGTLGIVTSLWPICAHVTTPTSTTISRRGRARRELRTARPFGNGSAARLAVRRPRPPHRFRRGKPAASTAATAKPTAPASGGELLKSVGINATSPATPAQMAALQKALVQPKPASASTLVSSIQGATGYQNITVQSVRAVAQGFVDMLPPPLAAALQPHAFSLEVKKSLPGALGDYNEGTHHLRLNGSLLDADPAKLRKTAWHEMIHWLHDHGPADFRARIETLFAARTNNFTDKKAKLKPFNSSKVTGFDDDFLDANGDEYAGRVYPWEVGKPRGYEIVTRHLEKLAVHPAELADHWNFKSPKTGRYAWREAFIECLHAFFPLPAPGNPAATAP